MALRTVEPATTKTLTDEDLETGAQVGVPRGRNGQPKIEPPTGGDLVVYTRASSLGKRLEDTFRLEKWRQRAIVWGMGRRVDLVRGAAAVATVGSAAERADRDELESLAERAMETARTSAGATSGTALHKLSEQAEAGADLSHLGDDLKRALDAYRRLTGGLTIHATETFVVHDGYQAAGSFDRLVSLPHCVVAPDGTRITPEDRLILDLKSNKSRDFWGPTYGCQQPTYAGGVPYVPGQGDHGRVGWPDGVAPHQGWALIPHVPVDSPVDAGWVWVNLAHGRRLADLACAVRDMTRKAALAGLFVDTDLEPVREATPAALNAAGLLGLVAAAGTSTADVGDALDALYDAHPTLWGDEHTEAARARVAELAGGAR